MGADIFDRYALYYNCLYQDKDYAAETGFVLDLLKKHGAFEQKRAGAVLDMGCGTGGHAFEMARAGISVHGVDLSEKMIELAKGNSLNKTNSSDFAPPVFETGDARMVRLDKKFDAAVSLFHVMSYQTSEDDLLAVLETAKTHLRPGGLFLFDFWHGPAVLKDRPAFREKRMSNAGVEVKRIARPELDLGGSTVDIEFDILVYDKASDSTGTFIERHLMRYWFLAELRFLSRLAGLEPIGEGAWMSESQPKDDDWYAWVLLKKQALELEQIDVENV